MSLALRILDKTINTTPAAPAVPIDGDCGHIMLVSLSCRTRARPLSVYFNIIRGSEEGILKWLSKIPTLLEAADLFVASKNRTPKNPSWRTPTSREPHQADDARYDMHAGLLTMEASELSSLIGKVAAPIGRVPFGALPPCDWNHKMKSKVLKMLSVSFIAMAGAVSALSYSSKDTPLRTENWASYGNKPNEQRFSTLDSVNIQTVNRLGVDWVLDLPDDRSLIGTPLVVDGVMYFTGSYSVTRAVDAATGRLLWQFDPKSIEHAGDRFGFMWDISRGLAYWKGKIVIATIDGRLIALDAKTGQRLWEQMTVDPSTRFYITGAPKIIGDKVIIGNGGTEHNAARGFVTAYDVNSGKKVWRFYIVPGNPADGFENKAMEMAAATWTGQWWKFGGGGNTWNGITYDPEFNQVLIGTGNGSPWNRKIRSPKGGDNLFLSSIVALDANTGAYRWHYQTTPGETWDYSSCMDIVLAELQIGGRKVKALMHAPKNGFFYVIDRSNGKLLSAEKFAKVTWASYVDLKTGRPVETPNARYENGPTLNWPSAEGAHNWPQMSYNPHTGLAYLPVMELPTLYDDRKVDIKNWKSPNGELDAGVLMGESHEIGQAALLAWDPVRQKEAWRTPLPNLWNGGTLTTAGDLVFEGRADGEFIAYDARTGKQVWSRNLGLGITAPPITYAIRGKQYVSILVGWGGSGLLMGPLAAKFGWAYRAQPRRLITFALDSHGKLEASPPQTFAKPLQVPSFVINEGLAVHGDDVYRRNCLLCHGVAAIAGGYAPDLRASKAATDQAVFTEIVRDGLLAPNGMPRFKALTDKGLQHYIRRMSRDTQKVSEDMAAGKLDLTSGPAPAGF
jgi:quinohemoprotein ethanol dehydrogenase